LRVEPAPEPPPFAEFSFGEPLPAQGQREEREEAMAEAEAQAPASAPGRAPDGETRSRATRATRRGNGHAGGHAGSNGSARGRGGEQPGERNSAPRAPWAGTPRNAACPCGSGKKFKHCHGRI
jgi:preprotein translocase subunit SecA